MTPENRKIALVAVLLICSVLVIVDRQGDANTGDVVGAVVRSPSKGEPIVAPIRSSISAVVTSGQFDTLIQPLLTRDNYKTMSDNVFSSVVFGQKITPETIVPVAIDPALSVPVAPNLPFSVIGKQRQGKTWEVFLAKADQTFVAHEGDMLTSVYQVVSIKPPNMQLLYLPLKQTQTLMIGVSFDD